tara:strand:- start:333 stop:665 length:333 start_codon:yes stop_codon:yes gene_type:complete
MTISKFALYTLKTLAILEGVSCIVLFFIAMPLKYFGGYENSVKIPGMAHGVLFVLYCLALLPVFFLYKWDFKILLISGLASIIPFGTFWADWKYFKPKKVNVSSSDILDI